MECEQDGDGDDFADGADGDGVWVYYLVFFLQVFGYGCMMIWYD